MSYSNNIFGSDNFSFDQTSFRKCTHVQSTIKYDNYNSQGIIGMLSNTLYNGNSL